MSTLLQCQHYMFGVVLIDQITSTLLVHGLVIGWHDIVRFCGYCLHALVRIRQKWDPAYQILNCSHRFRILPLKLWIPSVSSSKHGISKGQVSVGESIELCHH